MTEHQKLIDKLEDDLRPLFDAGSALLISRNAAIDVDAMIRACTEAVPLLEHYKRQRKELEMKRAK